jgi:hypothetical protein
MKLIRILSLAASTLITWALCLAVFLYTQPVTVAWSVAGLTH